MGYGWKRGMESDVGGVESEVECMVGMDDLGGFDIVKNWGGGNGYDSVVLKVGILVGKPIFRSISYAKVNSNLPNSMEGLEAQSIK